MGNRIFARESLDNHTRALDAICLAECVWWGSGEDLYRGWDHGIYEWRDLCWRMARWTHHAWEYVRAVCGECAWEFDVEFCPALVEYMLTSKLRLDPYADETDVLREFVKDITEAHEDE